MLEEARNYKLTPEEIFSKKNCTANDSGLAKTLFWDIVRQIRALAKMALVDASNCYNWIAHSMASQIFQSFGVRKPQVGGMFFLSAGFCVDGKGRVAIHHTP